MHIQDIFKAHGATFSFEFFPPKTEKGFENLFTNLTVPISFQSSGNACFGPHSAARSTFWNLRGPLARSWRTLPRRMR